MKWKVSMVLAGLAGDKGGIGRNARRIPHVGRDIAKTL